GAGFPEPGAQQAAAVGHDDRGFTFAADELDPRVVTDVCDLEATRGEIESGRDEARAAAIGEQEDGSARRRPRREEDRDRLPDARARRKLDGGALAGVRIEEGEARRERIALRPRDGRYEQAAVIGHLVDGFERGRSGVEPDDRRELARLVDEAFPGSDSMRKQ